jgi:hypothetical protein
MNRNSGKNGDICHNQVNFDLNQNNPVYRHTGNQLILFVVLDIHYILLEIRKKDKGKGKVDK